MLLLFQTSFESFSTRCIFTLHTLYAIHIIHSIHTHVHFDWYVMAVSLYPSSPGLMGRPRFTTKMWMYHVPFSCTARGTDTLSSFCRLPSPEGPSVQFPYCTPSSHIRYSALELKSKSSDSVKYTFKSCNERARKIKILATLYSTVTGRQLQACLVRGRHRV